MAAVAGSVGEELLGPALDPSKAIQEAQEAASARIHSDT